jgi:hypothetical protein
MTTSFIPYLGSTVNLGKHFSDEIGQFWYKKAYFKLLNKFELTFYKMFLTQLNCTVFYRRQKKKALLGPERHRWASTSISMSAISDTDIDICYSDIGDKYVRLKNVIPISEHFRYRHQSSFRYPTLKKKIYFIRQI